MFALLIHVHGFLFIILSRVLVPFHFYFPMVFRPFIIHLFQVFRNTYLFFTIGQSPALGSQLLFVVGNFWCPRKDPFDFYTTDRIWNSHRRRQHTTKTNKWADQANLMTLIGRIFYLNPNFLLSRLVKAWCLYWPQITFFAFDSNF